MRAKLFAVIVSALSLVSTDQAVAGNAGAAFVGGMIGGAIGSAIANSQSRTKKPRRQTAPSKPRKSSAPATARSTTKSVAPDGDVAANGAPWLATPMPNGLMVVTNAQGLSFSYDIAGKPRLIIQPASALPATAVAAVPVSVVVDGSVFGLLQARVDSGTLLVDDPQVLGLEQRLKPAKEVTFTSAFSTNTVKLSGFAVAIDQLALFRQQQAMLAASNPAAVQQQAPAAAPAPAPAPAPASVPAVTTAAAVPAVPAAPAVADTAAAPAVQQASITTTEPVVTQPAAGSVNLSAIPALGAQSRKVALVIGNGAYQNAGQLANPRNDATAMTRMLSGLGFKVISSIDASKPVMEESIREFIQDARSADVSLFFYSGHGMEVAGENFLLPVDVKLDDEAALNFEVVNSKVITNSMGGENKVGIILLDACRDNPFTKSLRRKMVASRAASVSNGLAPISADGGGLVVAFATAPGDVAADGDSSNSPFTTALLKWVPQKGLEIDQVMKRVKAEVSTITNNDQRPWTNSDLTSDVFLAGQ